MEYEDNELAVFGAAMLGDVKRVQELVKEIEIEDDDWGMSFGSEFHKAIKRGDAGALRKMLFTGFLEEDDRGNLSMDQVKTLLPFVDRDKVQHPLVKALNLQESMHDSAPAPVQKVQVKRGL